MAALRKPLSPYSASDLACARHVVTHAEKLLRLDPVERADIITLALNILRKDRAFRRASGPVFTNRPTTHTPGDAA